MTLNDTNLFPWGQHFRLFLFHESTMNGYNVERSKPEFDITIYYKPLLHFHGLHPGSSRIVAPRSSVLSPALAFKNRCVRIRFFFSPERIAAENIRDTPWRIREVSINTGLILIRNSMHVYFAYTGVY